MLVAFLAYKDQFSLRVGKFLDAAVKLGTLRIHGERLADITFTEAEEQDARHHFAPTVKISRNPTLTARGIGFRYSDSEPHIITNFELDVAPGECVALAGPSGAGKTLPTQLFTLRYFH